MILNIAGGVRNPRFVCSIICLNTSLSLFLRIGQHHCYLMTDNVGTFDTLDDTY